MKTLAVETGGSGMMALDTLLVQSDGALHSLVKQLGRHVVLILEAVQEQVL